MFNHTFLFGADKAGIHGHQISEFLILWSEENLVTSTWPGHQVELCQRNMSTPWHRSVTLCGEYVQHNLVCEKTIQMAEVAPENNLYIHVA